LVNFVLKLHFMICRVSKGSSCVGVVNNWVLSGS